MVPPESKHHEEEQQMAKISAYGDTELARWRRGRESAPGAPYEMVLTNGGRLLYKAAQGGTWAARRGRGSASPGRVNMDQALAQAAMFRMERV
jgi:hypothetical protein